MDAAAFECAITPRTRAVMPVDLFGHPADLMQSARSHAGTASQSSRMHALHSARRSAAARSALSSDVTCFSFAPTKHLGAYGSAGACLTEDAALAERMRKISGYGQSRSRHRTIHAGGIQQGLYHETDGLNERLDEVQAAILRVKLCDLDATLGARREQAARYESRLRGSPIDIPRVAEGVGHAWRNYVIEMEERGAARHALAEARYPDKPILCTAHAPPAGLFEDELRGRILSRGGTELRAPDRASDRPAS